MLRPEAYRTLNALNLDLLDRIDLDGATGMPVIRACGIVPDRMAPFNRARRREDAECGVHFYIEDYAFECVWHQPERYLGLLSRFRCVVSPDFSTYLDMPVPMVRWQIYRRRLLTQWMQRRGIDVVYSAQTLPSEYDDDQLSGVEGGGVISMRTPLYAKRNTAGRNEFYRVLEEILRRLSPKMLLIYGNELPLPTSINFKFYHNDNIGILRSISGGKGGILAEGPEEQVH